MADPRFRRNLILVAMAHLAALAAFFYFSQREIRKPSGEVVWMDPGAFSAPADSGGAPEVGATPEATPEPTPEPTPNPTPEPTPE
ncbi:MAG: hypothetical protein WCO94_04650, partial [Verrucomicrobiota bacterium]